MGVPKFFRWISERYPCLSQLVKGYDIPEFDNLYLDMNGIIHQCSHPEDDNIHFRMSEEKMFSDIFHYIDFLFRLIKPRKVFFMAIDGVAPRAKMNQQRSRRFRSAKEAEIQEKKALMKGEELPKEARFDSNCITPGTGFMARLQAALMKFTEDKVGCDPLWKGVKVVLSGHQTPGEGEHKIMEFIRYERSQPNYDPLTRHCLYGLDADLIMLGLTSHQPHFSLLREEVRFGKKEAKKVRPNVPEDINFFLLHLSLLRDYIDLEFQSLRSALPFGYNLERIIDDWILLGFLVGNDFIPHLPNLHIHNEALPMLWNTYKKVLPTLSGYLHDNGFLNFTHLEAFFATLAQFDKDTLEEQCADFQWLKGKRGAHMAESLATLGLPAKTTTESKEKTDTEDDDFRELEPFEYESGVSLSDDDDDDWLDAEMVMMKRDYYSQKLGIDFSDSARHTQTVEYVKGLQWILHYYYHGVPSWGWFYPQHYAPFISDVKDFSDLKVDFDFGKPFLPFQQLMAVLPAASQEHLPECLRSLMTSHESPVIDFYPQEFETDLNGKKQDWEAVVLIPFINEERLLRAMEPLNALLSSEEAERNCHGPHLLHEYDSTTNRAKRTPIPPDGFRILPGQVAPPTPIATFRPGFPVLKHVKFSSELTAAKVKVFQQPSRSLNTVLRLHCDETTEEQIEVEARKFLGKPVFVEWPLLSEVLPLCVITNNFVYNLQENGGRKGKSVVKAPLTQNDRDFLKLECRTLKEDAFSRRAIDCGSLECIVRGKPLQGRQVSVSSNGAVVVERQWSSSLQPYLWQRVVSDLTFNDPDTPTLKDVLYVGAPVFALNQNFYGCQGEVSSVNASKVVVKLHVLQQPDLSRVRPDDHFLSANAIADCAGVNSHFVSRITGSVFVKLPNANEQQNTDGSSPKRPSRPLNVGLNLKQNKHNLEVAGWTRKDPSIGWTYSPKIVDVLREYERKLPLLYDYLSQNPGEDDFSATKIWSSSPVPVEEISEFLKQLPCASAERVPIGGAVLSDATVRDIQKELVRQRSKLKKTMTEKDFKPSQLFVSLNIQGHCLPDPSVVFHLLDRVVACRSGLTVPLGNRGSVIGIQSNSKESEILLDILFDDDFEGSITLRNVPQCYRLPAYAVMNISHGDRLNNRHTKQANYYQGRNAYDNSSKYSDVWNSLQQQRQQKDWQHQQEVDQFSQRPLSYSALQQQTVCARQTSFDFGSLVNALSVENSHGFTPKSDEEQADELISSLCEDWQWPLPSWNFRKLRYGMFSAAISFPNGFSLTSQTLNTKAEAKLDVAYQLRDYCNELASVEQQQYQNHKDQHKQQNSNAYNSILQANSGQQAQPASSYQYHPPEQQQLNHAVPHPSHFGIYQTQPSSHQQPQVSSSDPKQIEAHLHNLLNMGSQQQRPAKSKQSKKKQPPRARLGINFSTLPSAH